MWWPWTVSCSVTCFQLDESANAPWTTMTVAVMLGSFRVEGGARVRSGKGAAEHPGRLLVCLDALGEEVGGGFVVCQLHSREDRLCRVDDCVLTGDEAPDHLGGVRLIAFFDDGGSAGELPVAGRRERVEGADPLGDQVDGEGELVVLLLEEQVETVEHRAGDVPVVVVGLEVERVAVRQQAGEPVADRLAVGSAIMVPGSIGSAGRVSGVVVMGFSLSCVRLSRRTRIGALGHRGRIDSPGNRVRLTRSRRSRHLLRSGQLERKGEDFETGVFDRRTTRRRSRSTEWSACRVTTTPSGPSVATSPSSTTRRRFESRGRVVDDGQARDSTRQSSGREVMSSLRIRGRMVRVVDYAPGGFDRCLVMRMLEATTEHQGDLDMGYVTSKRH